MPIVWTSLLLSTKGRLGRKGFWVGFALVIVGSVALNMVPLIGKLLGFLLIWPQIAIAAKRLHDLGQSAWLLLAPFVISIAAFILAAVLGGAGLLTAMQQGTVDSIWQAAGGLGLSLILVAVAFGTGFAFLLWLCLARGDDEPNRFGPPPLLLR